MTIDLESLTAEQRARREALELIATELERIEKPDALIQIIVCFEGEGYETDATSLDVALVGLDACCSTEDLPIFDDAVHDGENDTG